MSPTNLWNWMCYLTASTRYSRNTASRREMRDKVNLLYGNSSKWLYLRKTNIHHLCNRKYCTLKQDVVLWFKYSFPTWPHSTYFFTDNSCLNKSSKLFQFSVVMQERGSKHLGINRAWRNAPVNKLEHAHILQNHWSPKDSFYEFCELPRH